MTPLLVVKLLPSFKNPSCLFNSFELLGIKQLPLYDAMVCFYEAVLLRCGHLNKLLPHSFVLHILPYNISNELAAIVYFSR